MFCRANVLSVSLPACCIADVSKRQSELDDQQPEGIIGLRSARVPKTLFAREERNALCGLAKERLVSLLIKEMSI